MKKLLWFSFAFILLVNTAILAKAFYNRLEPAEAVLELTERELHLPGNYGFSRENSGIALTLDWFVAKTDETDTHEYRYERTLKLRTEHYQTLGFPESSCADYHRNPIKVWVLMEFNGAAHQQFINLAKQKLAQVQAEPDSQLPENKHKLENAKDNLKVAEETGTRLFAIDAAADKTLLDAEILNRQKNPNNMSARYITLPALVRQNYYDCDNVNIHPNQIYIDRLLLRNIHLPRKFHFDLSAEQTGRNSGMRYQASVAFGRFYEPWIKSFEPTPLQNKSAD